MREMTLDDYVNWQWVPHVEADGRGGFRLTLDRLNDFDVFGATEEEVYAEWKSALRSHLTGYLNVGKVVPIPRVRIPETSELETSTGSSGQVVFLSSDLQVRLLEPAMA